jgi:chaperonin cofactor prefoldin
MDPLTIFVGAVLSLLTIGGGFIFKRQEDRIAALESRLETLSDEHTECREENARLKERVREMERRLGIEADDE